MPTAAWVGVREWGHRGEWKSIGGRVAAGGRRPESKSDRERDPGALFTEFDPPTVPRSLDCHRTVSRTRHCNWAVPCCSFALFVALHVLH